MNLYYLHSDPKSLLHYESSRELVPLVFAPGGDYGNFPKNLSPAQIKTISTNAEYANQYAKHVIKGRWPEAEPYIMKDALAARRYAFSIIKGRWPEAELMISKNAEAAGLYAHYVIKDRWPKAEHVIMKSPECAFYYAVHVIKGRWLKAEPYIKRDSAWWDRYQAHFLFSDFD